MSHVQKLTQGKQIVAAKRQQKDNRLVVNFDEEARKEFLTGFHKRKLERIRVKAERRMELEKQARLAERRERREALKAQMREKMDLSEEEHENEDTGLDNQVIVQQFTTAQSVTTVTETILEDEMEQVQRHLQKMASKRDAPQKESETTTNSNSKNQKKVKRPRAGRQHQRRHK